MTSNENMVMPVAPAYNGFGNDGFGGDWGWIILLLLFAGGGMWGNGFGGYGGMMYEFPWLLNGQNAINANTNAGFDNLAVQNQISAVQSDIGDIQTQLCGGFAGVNATVNNGFANAEANANARQMANMQQAFNSQTAVVGAITDLASQQANCCCENRLATCQTQNIIQNEGNATRFADANNTRDLLTAFNSGIQSIKDQLCQDKIDAKNDTIDQLRTELIYSRGQASQDVQTARILAGQTAEVDALYNRLSSCPVPSMPVYGNQPIFSYSENSCGCGNF